MRLFYMQMYHFLLSKLYLFRALFPRLFIFLLSFFLYSRYYFLHLRIFYFIRGVCLLCEIQITETQT